MTTKKQPSQKTVRLSLQTLLLVAVVVVAIGSAGGVIGSWLVTPTLPPLTSDQKQFITTVQEVTVSPSTQSTALVERLQRSTVLLVDEKNPTARVVGTGVVVTNDGLIVTTVDLGSTTVSAIDSTGTLVPLSTIGRDELYGLTYVRVEEGVIPPFELSTDNPKVSAQLLALSLSASALSPRSETRSLTEYIAPPTTTPDGIMRLGVLSAAVSSSFVGAPLINEEGKLVGLVDNADEGQIIVVEALRASLARIAADQREVNPFEEWGIEPAYGFTFNETVKKRLFTVTVATVSPASSAATAGLRRGDHITRIQTTDLTWDTNIPALFTSAAPLTVTIKRGELTQTLTLNPPLPSS